MMIDSTEWLYSLKRVILHEQQVAICFFRDKEDAENAAYWLNLHWQEDGYKDVMFSVELIQIV